MKRKRITIIVTISLLLILSLFVTTGLASGNPNASENGISHRVAVLENLFEELKQMVLGNRNNIASLEETVASQKNEILALKEEINEIWGQIGQTSEPPPTGDMLVTGRVTLQDGTPVTGALVKLVTDGGSYSTSTNWDGYYNIDVDHSGPFHVLVVERDYLVALQTNITITAGTPTVVDLVLVEGGKIEGNVTYAEGLSITYTHIILMDDYGTVLNLAHVRPDGSYQFNSPVGTYTLQLRADGGRQINQEVTVVANQTETKDFTIYQ